ncbi:MAG TPA: hypothetical protein DEH78_27875 [Solibacterales bacterium]|nr:hypothetical protein [Bryobacterales bacterium]
MKSLLPIYFVFAAPAVWPAGASHVKSVHVEGPAPGLALFTRAGSPLDEDTLTRDVRQLWETGSYEDVRVERLPAGDGVAVVFHLDAKPKTFLGRVTFTERSPDRKLRMAEGAEMDRRRAHTIAQTLQKQLRDEGFAFGRVSTELAPAGLRRVDLHIDVDAGGRYRISGADFAGDAGVPESALRRALRLTRKDRPYVEDAVDADLHRLRSLYARNGYFDARAGLAGVGFQGDRVQLTFSVEAGRKYDVREDWWREECRCLLAERRQSEAEGRLDFTARLLVRGAPKGGLRIERETHASEPYRVRRIQFHGNHVFGDLTLRRALVLDEGAPFDPSRLGRSVVRLNRLGLLRETGENDVRVVRDEDARTVDIAIHVKDGPRGRWSLSGPAGTMRLGGPLSGSLVTRLPVLSTFNAAVSLMAFANPFSRLLPAAKNREWQPFARIDRPYLVGHGWSSGFTLMPQAGWQGMAALYGVNQAQGRLMGRLRGETPEPQPLAVAVERVGDDAAPRVALTLLCEPERSKWRRVRTSAVFAAEMALSLGLAGW